MGSPPMNHHSGGTIPALSLLQSALGIPTTVFGWGLGEKIHAPNERVLASMLEKGRVAWVMLLMRLAGEGESDDGAAKYEGGDKEEL